MAIEEPNYRIMITSEDLELRVYEPRILAQTLVSGSMDKASKAGFMLIADYIFGNNSSSDGSSKKISMTAPVTLQPQSASIRMTVSETMEQAESQWLVNFVMPEKYTLQTLPAPNSPVVAIQAIPAGHYAAIRFSGLASASKTANKTAELMAWLDSQGIVATSRPVLALYNSPWTLPFLRRNEVILAYRVD